MLVSTELIHKAFDVLQAAHLLMYSKLATEHVQCRTSTYGETIATAWRGMQQLLC